MYLIVFLCLKITRLDIRPHILSAVSLVIIDSQLISSRGCVGEKMERTQKLRKNREMKAGNTQTRVCRIN